jgi:hypothetical protein
MNKEWVNEKLDLLAQKLGSFKQESINFFFEPTEEIYKKLESGDENELYSVIVKISKHLEISRVPAAKYDWGIKMEPEIAGQALIKNVYPFDAIRIPFYYVGKKYAVGEIISHEITHVFLFSKGIFLNDVNENELLTDLTSVFIGLGKLVLNGKIVISDDSVSSEELGYLPFDLIVYAFKKICVTRSISMELAIKNLVPEVVSKINLNYE